MGDQTIGTTTTTGTAAVQAALWGARAHDWAQMQESTLLPMYRFALQRTGVGPGMRVLDIGCGAGLFLQEAAQLGAQVTGVDATQPLLDIASARTPEGRFLQGEEERLQLEDHIFDVVTGFNSFQYAASPVRALIEARRVARPGAPVVIVVWGREADCEAAKYVYSLGKRLPPPPPGAPGPFALSEPGALHSLAQRAGLTANDEGDVACPFHYPDEVTALRALLSAGPAVRAMNAAGEDMVRSDVLETIAPYRKPDGSYVLENMFRYVLATA